MTRSEEDAETEVFVRRRLMQELPEDFDTFRALLRLLDVERARVDSALLALPKCRKNVDMNVKPECYVLMEDEPCWVCQVRFTLEGKTLDGQPD